MKRKTGALVAVLCWILGCAFMLFGHGANTDFLGLIHLIAAFAITMMSYLTPQ